MNRGGLATLEDAVELLREGGVASIALYFTGALPWATAFVYFAADMGYSAHASSHLPEYSLALALLFIWKNFWQVVYSNALYDELTGARRLWTASRVTKALLITSAVQPISIVVLPLSLLITVPYAQALAFFKNVQLFCGSGEHHPIEKARQIALRDSKQNWIALSVISIASILALFNITVLLAILPQLARSFFGIEGELNRMGGGIVNPIFVMSAALIVYLCFDPLLDAFYVLRCFQNQSVSTGQDLRIAFKRSLSTAMLLLVAFLAVPVKAATTDPHKLDQSMNRVLERDEFVWRMPNQTKPPAWADGLSNLWKRLTQIVEEIWKALTEKEREEARNKGTLPNSQLLESMLYGAVAVFVVLLGVLLYLQRKRKVNVAAAAAVTLPVKIDLKDETVTADQLPESQWLQLADDHAGAGEFRLATRALYLAGLNHLMQRNLVSIQRWKSGLEYFQELERRARAMPSVASTFARGLGIFEKGWYGLHAVDEQAYRELRGAVEEMRLHAGA